MDDKWNILSYVILVLDGEWDPNIIDCNIDDDDGDADSDDRYDVISDTITKHNDTLFDNVRNINIDIPCMVITLPAITLTIS